MRIGEVASATGVSTRALRYYEEQGLLISDRSPSGQRRYSLSAVERVQWIQSFYTAGLDSKEIAKLLPCVYGDITTPSALERVSRERDRVDAQVRDLTDTRDRLDAVIAISNGFGPTVSAGPHRATDQM